MTDSQRDAIAALKKVNAAFRMRTVRDGNDVVVSLDLSGTNISDTDCLYLSEMTHLESLRLTSCMRITNGGLFHLKNLTRLRTLYLTSTNVTGEGLVNLKGLESLKELNLSSTRVNDAGLKHLEGLQNLSYLALYETRVTDAGLEHLAALRGLERLWLNRTRVTDEGVNELLRKLPNCRVDH